MSIAEYYPSNSQAGHIAASSTAPMVLHVRVVTQTGGGPEKTILNSPRFLQDLGYDSRCAYLRPPNDPGFETIERRAEVANAGLIAIDDRGAFDVRVFRRLLKICREHKVAIWHGHDYKSNFIGLMLRRFHRMQLVTTVHGWGVRYGWRSSIYYRVDKACIRRFDRVVCVSDDLLDECVRIGVPPERCLLIENGIDEAGFRKTDNTARVNAELGLPACGFLVGTVGRLSSEKAYDCLIDAVARLRRSGREVGLAIIGEGDQRAALESQIAALDLEKHVKLLGYRADVAELVQACDLFALSSLREGLPNVLLEAMALETPVVATRIAGIPRLIEDGANGRLVDPGDAVQLANAITKLMDDPAQRCTFAAAGRRTIEERYSFRRRMEKIAAIYDELLGNSRK